MRENWAAVARFRREHESRTRLEIWKVRDPTFRPHAEEERLALAEQAKATAKRHGWRMRVHNAGMLNDTHLIFHRPNDNRGDRISVWYPYDGRVADADMRELRSVIERIEQG